MKKETAITSQDAAKVLFNCATLLEMAGANRYRVAAYRRAAQIMLRLGDVAPQAVANDEAMKGLGFGRRLTRKLRELFATGEMNFYDELLADQPLPVARLVRVPGIGPKTALRLYNELGIASPTALATAARAGEIHKLRGFGPKREALWSEAPAANPVDDRGPAFELPKAA